MPRRSTRPYTKVDRRARCSSPASARSCSLVVRQRSTSSGKPFRAGGYVGEWLAGAAVRLSEPHRLDHRDPDADLPGDHPRRRSSRSAGCSRRSSQALATGGGARLGVVARVARGAPARQAAPGGDRQAHRRRRGADAGGAKPPRRRRRRAPQRRGAPGAGRARPRRSGRRRDAPRRGRRRWRRRKPPTVKRAGAAAAAAAAGAEPRKAPAERRKGGYTLPPLALLDAPKAERKIDERELMDGARLLEEKCREFSVEGTVVQIHPGPGRHDLRVQAGRRREVQQDHRPRRRPVPGDAGRVGADRSHPRQVHRRHPDSESATASRSRCASCSSRTPTGARRRS